MKEARFDLFQVASCSLIYERGNFSPRQFTCIKAVHLQKLELLLLEMPLYYGYLQ